MKSGSSTIRAARRRLVRGVAVLLLLLTGIGLTFPDCCGEESVAADTPVSATRKADNAAVLNTASEGSDQDQPTRPAPCNDECFCCLRMLQSVSVASVSAPLLVTPPLVTKTQHLPSPPPRVTYHPPRTA
jgi:hypothetical protein